MDKGKTPPNFSFTPPTTGFGFLPTTTTTASALSFGSLPSTTATNAGLSFEIKPASTTSSSVMNFFPTSVTTTSGTSFGITPTTTAALSFGIPASTPATSGGLSFVTPSTTASLVPGLSFGITSSTPASPSAMSFGSPLSTAKPAPALNFSVPAKMPSLSFPIPATSAETSSPIQQVSTSSVTSSSGVIPSLPAISAATPLSSLGKTSAPLLPTPTTQESTMTTAAASKAITTSTTTTATTIAVGTSVATTASLGGIAPPGGQQVSFAQLEDMINKWTGELGEMERLFLNQATQINAWDNLLCTNAAQLSELQEAVGKVKADQKKINLDLDFILAQQRELDECLKPLEQEYTSSVYSNDIEREKIYFMAETIDSSVKRMSEDLKETIDLINEVSRSQETVDPVMQVGMILNSLMNSLQWVDENTTKIQTQIEQATKIHSQVKRSYDRVDSLYY